MRPVERKLISNHEVPIFISTLYDQLSERPSERTGLERNVLRIGTPPLSIRNRYLPSIYDLVLYFGV